MTAEEDHITEDMRQTFIAQTAVNCTRSGIPDEAVAEDMALVATVLFSRIGKYESGAKWLEDAADLLRRQCPNWGA